MSSNLPPGVSENTYGAPWNDEDFEFTLEVTIGGSIQGPLSQEEYDEQEWGNNISNAETGNSTSTTGRIQENTTFLKMALEQ